MSYLDDVFDSDLATMGMRLEPDVRVAHVVLAAGWQAARRLAPVLGWVARAGVCLHAVIVYMLSRLYQGSAPPPTAACTCVV